MPSIKIYSKEQVDDLISGVAPPTVVQTTGSSTTDVMSQDAVTTALGNKADTSALPTSSQLVPSTSGASSGDVLSFNGTSTEWATPSSGGITAHTYTTFGALAKAVYDNNGNGFLTYNSSGDSGIIGSTYIRAQPLSSENSCAIDLFGFWGQQSVGGISIMTKRILIYNGNTSTSQSIDGGQFTISPSGTISSLPTSYTLNISKITYYY